MAIAVCFAQFFVGNEIFHKVSCSSLSLPFFVLSMFVWLLVAFSFPLLSLFVGVVQTSIFCLTSRKPFH
jgi:disulfide bond formation protein DsbB